MKTVTVLFNGVEEYLFDLQKSGIRITGMGIGGGGNAEVTFVGEESSLREFFAKCWNMNTEVNELFEQSDEGQTLSLVVCFGEDDSSEDQTAEMKAIIEDVVSLMDSKYGKDVNGYAFLNGIMQ
jgi:hypothetical protein